MSALALRNLTMDPTRLASLHPDFDDRLQENIPLSSYTSARIGGPADVLLVVRSADELAQAAEKLWALDVPFLLLGGGANVLVSDKGVRGVVVINRAREVQFSAESEPPTVRAESGATLNDLSRRAALLGLSGLEWAATVPGSLGGAVYGNAGAFDGDIAASLVSAELLHRTAGRQTWPVQQMEYDYRNSALKRQRAPVVILSAELALEHGSKDEILVKMERFSALRHKSQPSGASLGSMFKNPPGDYAGRLIEAAGLKGRRIGNAEISPVHANFFINRGRTRAEDVKALIDLARDSVAEQFGVKLELEIELIGEW
jgi:UDP-N-acetylmuramate dehydrogenase